MDVWPDKVFVAFGEGDKTGLSNRSAKSMDEQEDEGDSATLEISLDEGAAHSTNASAKTHAGT